MRFLVVEDEAAIAEQIKDRLEKEGYVVEVAADGQEGLYQGSEYPFDGAVIDLGLPELSGIELIEQLREKDIAFPILILTARGAWQEKVKGLEAGADDYMVKPFHMEELLARLKALLRRSSGWATAELSCGVVSLNMTSQQVKVDGKEVELTAFEYKALEYLMLHAGKVISKTELTEHLYDQDYERDSNVIEVFVGRLRRKLDPDNLYHPIETLRGRGYRIAMPESETDE